MGNLKSLSEIVEEFDSPSEAEDDDYDLKSSDEEVLEADDVEDHIEEVVKADEDHDEEIIKVYGGHCMPHRCSCDGVRCRNFCCIPLRVMSCY